jgi:ligand-binding sensor domain-containing protein/two-component sensor histidine kinase
MTPAISKLTSLSLACLFLGLGVFSAQAQRPIRELYVETVHYDVRNGLPDNNIKKGLIDKNGLIWMMTNVGLSCFDGQHFFNFDSESPLFRISSNVVLDIALQDTLVYVATLNGIDVIDIRSKKRLKSTVIKDHIVQNILEQKGNLYAFTNKKVLIDLKHNRTLTIKDDSNKYTMTHYGDYLLIMNLKSSIYALIDPVNFKIVKMMNISRSSYFTDGLIHTKTRGLINLLRSGPVQFDPLSGLEKPIDDFVHQVTNYTDQLDRGEMYVIDYNLVMYRDQNIIYNVILDSPDYINFNQLLTDGRGTVYLLYSKGMTVFRVPPPFIRPLPILPTTVPDTYQVYKSIYEQSNGNLLLFTYLGIFDFNPTTWTVKERWNQWTYAVSGLEHDQALYFVTDGKGLARIDKQGYRSLPIPTLRDTEHAYSMFQNHKKELIVGYANPYGLYRFNKVNESLDAINAPLGDDKLQPRGIYKIIQDAKLNYWIATQNGLFVLNKDFQRQLVFDRQQKENDRKFESDFLYDLYVDADSTLWVGTSQGVYAIDMSTQRIVNPAQQPYLKGNRVASILDDDQGNLWVSTFTGLYVFNKKTFLTYRYFQEDGLPENEFNSLSSLKASDGKLYFGALNGYLQIDPSLWDPKLYETTLSINLIQKEGLKKLQLIDPMAYTTSRPLHVYADQDILNVQVSFNEYINPTYCKYWFRLSEQDPWLPFYDGNLRLRNLPIGNYVLQIKGTDAMGREELASLQIPLRVSVTLFNSNTFRYSLLLLFAASIIGFIYYRYAKILEISSIRKNIINDIHDEIGSILTKTSMKAELLAAKHTHLQQDLKQIQGYTREAVQSLRNLLWSLSSEKSTTVDFQDRVNEWLTFIFANSPFEVEFINEIPKTSFNLSISARRNVLLIIKELATNCLKHSKGNVFQLKLTEKNGVFELTAYDNGTNDTSTSALVATSAGFGLKSIANRVAVLGGTFNIKTDQQGFWVNITF